MTWGIIGAMPSEIALLETQMSGAKKEVVSGLTYQTGKICGKLPVDRKKIIILFFSVFLPLFLLLMTGGYFLG